MARVRDAPLAGRRSRRTFPPSRGTGVVLNIRGKCAYGHTVFCKTLEVQLDGVGENRIAQLGDSVRRQFPRIGNNGSNL